MAETKESDKIEVIISPANTLLEVIYNEDKARVAFLIANIEAIEILSNYSKDKPDDKFTYSMLIIAAGGRHQMVAIDLSYEEVMGIYDQVKQALLRKNGP